MIFELVTFSASPARAVIAQGAFSGEEYRTEHLLPALNQAKAKGEIVKVDFSRVFGATSGFIREAFGGLVKYDQFTAQDLSELLELVGDVDDGSQYYADLARDYIREAVTVH